LRTATATDVKIETRIERQRNDELFAEKKKMVMWSFLTFALLFCFKATLLSEDLIFLPPTTKMPLPGTDKIATLDLIDA